MRNSSILLISADGEIADGLVTPAILAATYYGTVVFLQTLFTSTTSERSPLVIV